MGGKCSRRKSPQAASHKSGIRRLWNQRLCGLSCVMAAMVPTCGRAQPRMLKSLATNKKVYTSLAIGREIGYALLERMVTCSYAISMAPSCVLRTRPHQVILVQQSRMQRSTARSEIVSGCSVTLLQVYLDSMRSRISILCDGAALCHSMEALNSF